MEAIHPDLFRAFLAVHETGSFTGAARMLGARQSTVSQQIKRLEALTARRLFARDTHHVALTVEGEALLDHAGHILDAHDAMARHLAATPLRGRLRFGASEDFVLSALPDVLASFARRHPEVDLAVTAGLSEDLYDAFDAGWLDLIFVKRRRADRRGTTVWCERPAWVAAQGFHDDAEAPLPLLLYPPPSVTRAIAVAALDAARRPWRVAFTSGSLSALTAAARAGVGVLPHSLRLVPPGLESLSPRSALPPLPELEFVIVSGPSTDQASRALADAVLRWSVTRKDYSA